MAIAGPEILRLHVSQREVVIALHYDGISASAMTVSFQVAR
jgi:hypothetical protein